MGTCIGTPRHLQWVLIVLRNHPLGPIPWRAVSSLVWSFADWTWSWGRLRCLRAILLEMPLLSSAITSPSLFTWVSLGIFLRLFQSSSNSHCWGFSLSSGSFFASCFPPCILYHNIPSEPAVTVFLKTDLVQTPVFVTYGRYLEPTEWEIYLLRLFLPLNFWNQHQ